MWPYFCNIIVEKYSITANITRNLYSQFKFSFVTAETCMSDVRGVCRRGVIAPRDIRKFDAMTAHSVSAVRDSPQDVIATIETGQWITQSEPLQA